MRHVFHVMMMVSIVTGRARAQSGDSATLAEQLFNQARNLAKANQWVEACPKFEASLRYDPVLGTRLNLAACYEHIDKLANAWGLYRESADLAKKAGDTKRRDYAQKQAAALERRLAKLTIFAPAKPPIGFAVTRDGAIIDAGAFGVTLFVDAGPHEITASAPSFQVFTTTVTLIEGKSETLPIPDLKATPAPKPMPDSPEPPVKDHVDRVPTGQPVVAASRIRRYIAISGGAVGVASVGVGLLFGAKANSSFSEAKALCGAILVCGPDDYPKGQQLMHDARSRATISTVFVTGGAAAIIASAIVYFTMPHIRERTTARLIPVAHDGDVGFAITGGF